MQKEVIIPYLIRDGQEFLFTKNLEAAVILIFVEVNRKKPILFLGEEDIDYISKLLYPLWAIPWEDKSIIIDGLNILSEKLSRLEIPNVNAFVEALLRGSRSPNLFIKALSDGLKLFDEPLSSKEITLESFVGDIDALNDLENVMTKIENRMVEEIEGTRIEPRLQEDEAVFKAKAFVDAWKNLKSCISALQYAQIRLKEEVLKHLKRVRNEIDYITRSYAEKIESTSVDVNEKVAFFEKEMQKELKNVEKTYRKRLKDLSKVKARREATLNKLKGSLMDYIEKRDAARAIGSEKRARYWTARIKVCRKQLDDARKNIKAVKAAIEKAKLEFKKKSKSIKSRYSSLIEMERRKIRSLENERDQMIKKKRVHIDEVKNLVEMIESKIKTIRSMIEKELQKLVSMSIEFKIEVPTILWIPFYLIRYSSPKKVRYKIIGPIGIRDTESLLRRIERILLSFGMESRMPSLTEPKLEKLQKRTFEPLQKKLETDSELENHVNRIATSNNLLSRKEFRSLALHGLAALSEKRWISQQEHRNLIEKYLSS